MLIIFVLQALVLVGASQHTYFVKPDNFSTSCPSQEHPCLTLDEYASNQSEFFTSNSTFLFLPGTHTTRTVVNLVNVSNIVLRGNDSNPELYLTDWSIECKSVVNLVLQGLTLTYTGGKHDVILAFRESSTLITYATFQGSTQFQATAINSSHSNATFEHCFFKKNDGGALILTRSKVLVSDSVFTENSAQKDGGAMTVSNSELISKSTFVSNSAPEAGGITCLECSLNMSSVQFINNSANKGGAVVVKNGEAVFSNTMVTHNSGTALCFFRSNIRFTGNNTFKENVNMMSASGGNRSRYVKCIILGSHIF